MWTVGVQGGLILQEPACFVCDGMDPALLSCPFCLTTSHSACLEKLVEITKDSCHKAPSLIDKAEVRNWKPRVSGSIEIRTCLWCWKYSIASDD